MTNDKNTYRVTIRRRTFGSRAYSFDTELELSLISDKVHIDELLALHPIIFDRYGFEGGIVVVAHIQSITSREMGGPEGDRIETKTGIRRLVDILFVGDAEI